MDRDQAVLTLMLLDPCLTADEAAREAAARAHTAHVIAETRTRSRTEAVGRKARRAVPTPAPEGPAVGF